MRQIANGLRITRVHPDEGRADGARRLYGKLDRWLSQPTAFAQAWWMSRAEQLGRHTLLLAGAISSTLLVAAAASAVDAGDKPASPIYGVTIPDGYRDWRLIAPALEDAPLNELRTVVGNDVAVKAYRNGKLPFPDGTVLVKIAWEQMRSPEFHQATVPGPATTVQVMVKDAKRWPATGGWGFGRFVNGKPVDQAQHETCFACHEARVSDRDFVFTRYAP